MTKIVAVDESGSFSAEQDSFSGIGALISDWEPGTSSLVTTGVKRIFDSAPSNQLRKGELKGSDLTPEQFTRACELVAQANAKICAFAFRTDEHFSDVPREEFIGMIRDCAKRAKAELLGDRWIAAARNCSVEDFNYSEMVLRLFENGVVQVICDGPMPEKIDVVFDPKLAADREEVLAPQVYLAFVNQLRGTFGYNNPGLFGLADSPWKVVAKAPDHEPFLTLVDWMIYPYVAVRRLGSRVLLGKTALQDRAEEALRRVNAQLKLGILKEAKIPRLQLFQHGVPSRPPAWERSK